MNRLTERRPIGRAALVWAASVAVLATGCASRERTRFPLRQALRRETDLASVDVKCRLEPNLQDPGHLDCAPRRYWSSLIWDGADNVVFRPISETLGLYLPGAEAVNVNSMDEVPDSSWFTNRVGVRPMSLEELQLGGCDASLILHPEAAADGTWIIDQPKGQGATQGFRIRVGTKRYLLKADDPQQPELGSAAQTIGLAIYHAVGFNTPCEQVVYFKPSLLKLTPGLRYEGGGLEVGKAFDQSAVDAIIARCPKRGGHIRMQASAWIPGYSVGPFRYEGTRQDDPNDVVAHQDRRELRASRLVAAWIDHVDAREGNTLDTWIADRANVPDSSPGHVVHYLLDTSESLGPRFPYEPVTRRAGYTYLFGWGQFLSDVGTLGIPVHSWDYVAESPGHELFVYYNVQDFVPDEWKMEYANAAFSRMTERDAAWMARILARFTPEMVHRLAEMGRLSNPDNTEYLANTLEGRLERMLDRYLTVLPAIADLRIGQDDWLCGRDLAEWRGVRPPNDFHYVAESTRFGSLPVVKRDRGEICMHLPHFAPDESRIPDDSSSRYIILIVGDGVAKGTLQAHLYDLGPVRGYRLVGIERDPPQ